MPELPKLSPTMDPKVIQDLQRIVREAEQGNQQVLPELRRLLDAHPEIWERFGNLALHAQESWKKLIAGKNLLLQESLERKLASMRDELTANGGSPLERLLAERVAACWLQTQFADVSAAQNSELVLHEAALRRLARAEHRLLKSIQALATLRKLVKRAPSPLELATRSVAETNGQSGTCRRGLRKANGTVTVN